jgi:DNA replication and repair protein RecF
MGLQNLSIRHFRCFSAVDLEFSPHLNVIEGKNASGKTSILEAIYLLSRGRSFRTANLETATQDGNNKFLLAARIASQLTKIEISLTRHDRSLKPRVAGKAIETLSQLAALLPVQLLDGEANHIIRGSPKYRRQFLDWGAFHVEPLFYETWRRYHRALKQRNSLLKAARPPKDKDAETWNVELAAHGERLNEMRQQYLRNLCGRAIALAEQSLEGISISLGYQRGWSEDIALVDALRTSSKRDQLIGATQTGPHRADLIIRANGKRAQEAISRGQEKVLAATLLLAQASLYQQQRGLSCTLLVDDLAAELDAKHLGSLLKRIKEVGSQVIMTTIEPLPKQGHIDTAVFHVKQGKCLSVV